MNVYLFCGLSNLIKGRSKEYLILASLFELKSPKFSLHSREKVGSFTTNVIFLENKNIKWSKKKKKTTESLMLQSQTEILDGAWERKCGTGGRGCRAAGGNPALGSLAGPPAVVLAEVQPSLSQSVCGSTARALSDRCGPRSPAWSWFWEISVLASVVDFNLWAYLIFIFCLVLNFCVFLCLYPFSQKCTIFISFLLHKISLCIRNIIHHFSDT